MYDIAVVGAGPAGYSAAIQARKRGKSVIIIGQNTGWLSRAERIDNYPGMPGVSGPEMLRVMQEQASAMGAEEREGLVHQIIPMGGSFSLSLGADFVEARRVILCTGARQPRLLPGEAEFLGRGVSYCATCDGRFYKGKHIAIIAEGEEAIYDTNYLAGLCARIDFYGVPDPEIDPHVVLHSEKVTAITGEDRAQALIADGEERRYDGVFIFREAMALSALLSGIETEGAFIRVDRRMATSVPGVFAAGDCTGLPLQVAKAVGEGCVAALSAAQEL